MSDVDNLFTDITCLLLNNAYQTLQFSARQSIHTYRLSSLLQDKSCLKNQSSARQIMPKKSVFCKTNHALKSVFCKTNLACNKQFPQDKSCPEKPVFCNKVHTQMLQVSGRLFIPIHSIPVFRPILQDDSYQILQCSAVPVIPIHSSLLQDNSYSDSPIFCKTVHTRTVQSSTRQFISRFSNLLQDLSHPDSPSLLITFYIALVSALEQTHCSRV